jgi:hypothetical protein
MDKQEQTPRPTHCTCGALLVSDALFCHRCGRPVFAHIVEPEIAPEPVTPTSFSVSDAVPPPPAPSPSGLPVWDGPPEPIDLRNRTVVRLGLFSAAMLFPPLVLLPLPVLLKALLICGGGFFAAWTYQRRTNSKLGFSNGFRLGWIAGLAFFMLLLGIHAIALAVVSFTGGNLETLLTEAMRASGEQLSEEQMQQVHEVFADGTKLFMVMALAIFISFLGCTALSGMGGVLAAMFSGSRPRAG